MPEFVVKRQNCDRLVEVVRSGEVVGAAAHTGDVDLDDLVPRHPADHVEVVDVEVGEDAARCWNERRIGGSGVGTDHMDATHGADVTIDDTAASLPVTRVEPTLKADLHRNARSKCGRCHLPGALGVQRDGFSQNTGIPAAQARSMRSACAPVAVATTRPSRRDANSSSMPAATSVFGRPAATASARPGRPSARHQRVHLRMVGNHSGVPGTDASRSGDADSHSAATFLRLKGFSSRRTAVRPTTNQQFGPGESSLVISARARPAHSPSSGTAPLWCRAGAWAGLLPGQDVTDERCAWSRFRLGLVARCALLSQWCALRNMTLGRIALPIDSSRLPTFHVMLQHYCCA